MMEFLEFTFRSFWHFAGVFILIDSIGTIVYHLLKGIAYIIHGVPIENKGKEDKKDESEEETGDVDIE